ncbi:hypothetical protein [Micromonospora humi]|uniref:Uncharacterized protein n=1 Tax=Micromonospora humi TaxID=745366 RepID=A0A1C5GLT3_9ACTN|nr:hypothetical protein [Micromonospora humi]SCG34735.1 hypothetical protein GA0070213_101271 [Micromonospora humi]
MELTVEVQPPDSPGALSTRHVADESRVDDLATAIALISRKLADQLDAGADSGQVWMLDGLEATFQLDLLPDAGVLLVRDDERHAVSVKCTYKRVPGSSEEPRTAP